MSNPVNGACSVCGKHTRAEEADTRSWRVVRSESTRSAERAMAGFPQPEEAHITGYRISEQSHPVPDTYVCHDCIADRESSNRPVMTAAIRLSMVIAIVSAVTAAGLWLGNWLELFTVDEDWLYAPILVTLVSGVIWAMSGADDELHRIAPIDQWHAEGLAKMELPFEAKLCPGLFDLEDEIEGVRLDDQTLPLPPELAVVRSDHIKRLLQSQKETGYAYFNCWGKLHHSGLFPARPAGLLERMPQYNNLGELLDQESSG